MEDKTNILLLVAGMRKEVQGLVSEVRFSSFFSYYGSFSSVYANENVFY